MIPRVKAYSVRIASDPDASSKDGDVAPEKQKDLVFEGEFNAPGYTHIGGKANLVTSHMKDAPGKHVVALDIDMPAQLFPSKTPGHYHLYIDKVMEWDDYVELLNALAKAGIIEQGYAAASIAKGCTALRLPKYDQAYETIKEQFKAGHLFVDDSSTEIIDATIVEEDGFLF